MKNFAKIALGFTVIAITILRASSNEKGRMRRDALTPTLNNLDSLL